MICFHVIITLDERQTTIFHLIKTYNPCIFHHHFKVLIAQEIILSEYQKKYIYIFYVHFFFFFDIMAKIISCN